MMILMFILISIFSLILLRINRQFSREQKIFEQKMEALQKIIVETNQKSIAQNHKIRLAEELEETIRTSRSKLGSMIFNLNYELFGLLSENNLLKPRK